MLLQDGKIEAEVKLTGILSLGALQPGETRKYGTTIAPGLYAPVHQHFFVARMDMAVDCKPSEAFNQVLCIELIQSLQVFAYLGSAGPTGFWPWNLFMIKNLNKSTSPAFTVPRLTHTIKCDLG